MLSVFINAMITQEQLDEIYSNCNIGWYKDVDVIRTLADEVRKLMKELQVTQNSDLYIENQRLLKDYNFLLERINESTSSQLRK